MRASREELVDTVLENGSRRRIYMHLLANPGDHYRNILRALGLGNGTLMYHLRVMEKAQILRMRKNGGRALYYPMEVAPGPLAGGPERHLVTTIARNPGISDRDIATGMSRSVRWVRANLGVLEECSLIGIHRRGGLWSCYLLLPEAHVPAMRPEGMYHASWSV